MERRESSSRHSSQQVLISGFLILGTTDILGGIIFVRGGGALCIIGCWVTSWPLPTRCQEQPQTSCDNQKWFQTLTKSPWGEGKITPVDNHCFRWLQHLAWQLPHWLQVKKEWAILAEHLPNWKSVSSMDIVAIMCYWIWGWFVAKHQTNWEQLLASRDCFSFLGWKATTKPNNDHSTTGTYKIYYRVLFVRLTLIRCMCVRETVCVFTKGQHWYWNPGLWSNWAISASMLA